MSSTRVSFGSRAGGGSDYPGVGQEVFVRPTSHYGSFDSLVDLSNALRNECADAALSDAPACTTSELSLSGNAIVPLIRPGVGPYSDGGEQDLPAEFKTSYTVPNTDGSPASNDIAYPQAPISAIVNVASPKERAIVQRAASRGIIQALEAIDGFRYSFNNAWAAKDEEGSRFSYICQDSMQNKDRHANGYQRTAKHLKGGEFSRGPRKPTYDCKGSVSVKFSTARQRVDVYYRHYAIHSTVAERKPPERPPPGSRRLYNSRAPAVSAEAHGFENPEMYDQPMYGDAPPSGSNIERPLKRKRGQPKSSTPIASTAKPLSLADILRQSSSANVSDDKSPPFPTSSNATPQQSQNTNPPPVNYELPSWQVPPPVPINRQTPGGGLPYPSPYPPPYTPTHARPAQARPTKPAPAPKAGQPVASHPKGQGLFATLKPIERNGATMSLPGQLYTPPVYGTGVMGQNGGFKFVNPVANGARAKVSCMACRAGKKKCDEGQPCTACIKSGLLTRDCVYEGRVTSTFTSRSAKTQDSNSNSNSPSLSQWTAPETSQSMASALAAPVVEPRPPNNSIAPSPDPNITWRNPLGAPSMTVLPDGDGLTPRERAAKAREKEVQAQRETGESAARMQNSATREESPDPWFPRR
ncbi:unnamed protein product [Zymoseptoria tritici ST99CH_3D1]|nr:unnamed protein product [Zymoseptoria tritici ST99CH_3D1]